MPTAARIIHLVNITLELPEDIAQHLSAEWCDLPRVALEAYRARKLSTEQMRRLLGFPTRFELDGFLKQHQVWDYTREDLDRDRAAHQNLGL